MNIEAATRWLGLHRRLLADEHRTQSYRRTIFQAVKPGSVVLDLGTGSGIPALFAIPRKVELWASPVTLSEACEKIDFWSHAFFPLEAPLPVKKGDVLSWGVDYPRQKMRFNHSSFFGVPWKKALVQKK